MKMKSHLASLLVLFATSAPLLSATETERLRALCAEQELQIAQLEQKIARLSDTPPPSRLNQTARTSESVSEAKNATYTVQAGDSIERIARKNGVSVNALGKLNGIKSDTIIHPGQKLMLPGTTATAEITESTPASSTAPSRTHTVASGETFYSISRKYDVSVSALIAANPKISPSALRIGQKIQIAAAPSPIVKREAPVSKPAASLNASSSIPISNSRMPVEKPKPSKGPVKIEQEITYGEFAKNHHTTTTRLDELNGLELDPSTVLAQGSELYIPAQP